MAWKLPFWGVFWRQGDENSKNKPNVCLYMIALILDADKSYKDPTPIGTGVTLKPKFDQNEMVNSQIGNTVILILAHNWYYTWWRKMKLSLSHAKQQQLDILFSGDSVNIRTNLQRCGSPVPKNVIPEVLTRWNRETNCLQLQFMGFHPKIIRVGNVIIIICLWDFNHIIRKLIITNKIKIQKYSWIFGVSESQKCKKWIIYGANRRDTPIAYRVTSDR